MAPHKMTANKDETCTCSSSEVSHEVSVTAEDWFHKGRRVPYDPLRKRILEKENARSVNVWERVVAPFEVDSTSRWLTMLPGCPDGTFGYSKLDDLVHISPRLYVEYVGLGDSDKPNDYEHTMVDRANLVEAQWRAHGVRRTVLICQSFSSMVMMELLNRQTERLHLGLPVRTRIEHVLCLNGAYFSHTHTPHPMNSSIIIKNTLGKLTMKVAQRSDIVLEPILRKCFTKDYNVSKEELKEIGTVVRRHKGTNYFTGSASRYVEDHKKHADRWNIVNVYNMTRRQGVSFMFVAGEQDKFESKSFKLAREMLEGKPDAYFEMLPGGYMLNYEHPNRIADMIHGVAMSPAFSPDIVSDRSSLHKRTSNNTDSDASTLSTANSSLDVSNSDGWVCAEYEEYFEYTM